MKKQYKAPLLTFVTISHQTQLLSASPGIVTSEGPASATEEVLSRQGGSFWDDDEE